MRRKTGHGQGDDDHQGARRHMRALRRNLETYDPETDTRRAVPRAIEEADDLEIPGTADRRRARGVTAGEYARGARRRAAPVSSP